jgi:hypothetical protein
MPARGFRLAEFSGAIREQPAPEIVRGTFCQVDRMLSTSQLSHKLGNPRLRTIEGGVINVAEGRRTYARASHRGLDLEKLGTTRHSPTQ